MPRVRISKRHKSIAIGLACGLLCAACVGAYIAQVDERANAAQQELLAKYGGEQIDVCVAKRDIMAGETILDGDIETRTWIAAMLPANAIVDKKDAVGKKVGSTVLCGEVISSARFGFDNQSIDVPDGLVAVSVPTREVQAVGGALEVGMTADVYSVGATSTSRIAKGVQVLATSAGSDRSSATSDSWVTLAIQPATVQEFVTAIENTQIYFVLPSDSAREAEEALANAASAPGAAREQENELVGDANASIGQQEKTEDASIESTTGASVIEGTQS